jgi:negative regulator of sigma-B (phosphoserine phosphatase)
MAMAMAMKPAFAYRALARHGEAHCGDAVLAQVTDAGSLFAVIDALGHGDTAWQVAERAMASLLRQPPGVDVETAFTALNSDLQGTRGAAVTLCIMRGLQADFIGAGNVTCRTLGAPMPFLPRPGIVGSLRKIPRAMRIALLAGQRLVLHSDGISHRFDLRQLGELSPDEACAWILSHQRHSHDDASVLIIDVRATVEVTR